MNEREFLKRLMATFQLEARELLDAMSAGLVRLEAVPDDEDALETIFRDAHSLKGASRAVNLAEIARLCHRLEDVFSEWKNGRLSASPKLLDALHRAIDDLQQVIVAIDPADVTCVYSPDAALRMIDIALKGGAEVPPEVEAVALERPTPIPEELPKLAEPRDATNDATEPGTSDSGRNTTTSKLPRADTVRIPAARLDSILLQTEELLGVKLAAAQRASDLSALQEIMRQWTRDAQRDDTDNETRAAIAHKLAGAARESDRDQRVFSTMLDGLLTELKQALMLPVGTLLEGLPKLVRDLAREQGKEIDLTVKGDQIEVDRRVLEELRNPVVHIIRNCVDHAIEPPSERLQKGKDTRGEIEIHGAQLENKYFELRIRDDGRGFNKAALRAAALRSGILSSEMNGSLDHEDFSMLAFHSGVSTSPILTDLSGRGLGLAIVRNNVERLGGTVTLREPPDGGSEISLKVPITLATFRGVLVKSVEQTFLMPTHSVRKVLRARPDALESVEGQEVLRVDGEFIALARLDRILGLPTSRGGQGEDRAPCALIVESGNSRIALLVDEIVAEQEVLVKGLGRQLVRVRHITGAAILGNGTLVPILHLPDILHSAMHGGARTSAPHSASPAEKRTASVLLAEDSITARTLLKTILETAGYQVFPAVDGAEAWATLRTNRIDLVISDVEMPRMNGFELASRIRANKELRQIPIILVTALESREDRERGIEAGANAYIVKSSFDQSNLFEAIKRLL